MMLIAKAMRGLITNVILMEESAELNFRKGRASEASEWRLLIQKILIDLFGRPALFFQC